MKWQTREQETLQPKQPMTVMLSYKLAEDNQEQLKGLITEIAKDNHKKGSIPQKIGDLYNLGMDSATIEKQGAEPLKGELQSIAAMSQKRDITNRLAIS